MEVYVILAAVVAVGLAAYVAGKNSVQMPAPEAKRFGLEQAEAAMSFVKAGGAVVAQSVLGVVVGVLGYENTVAGDVDAEVSSLAAANQGRDGRVAKNEGEIEKLRAEIERLRAANSSADSRAEQLRQIAEIFRG